MHLFQCLRRAFSRIHLRRKTNFQIHAGLQLSTDLKVLEKIAECGMGSVWKAFDSKLQKTVVLKFPLQQSPMSAAFLAQECNSCQVLQHKNIVKVYGLRKIDSQHICLEEEFIVGQNFEDWRTDQPNLCFPWHEIKQYALEIADGLAYAHSLGVCHCDIKPRNIMRAEVGDEKYAKIIDFGISARQHILGTLSPISTGAHSLNYASPQQLGGLPPQPSDDIYSFCSTLYHLLTGCTVFEGIPGDPEDMIRYLAPPDPNERLKNSSVEFRIPEEVVKAILLGLRKQRKTDQNGRIEEAQPTDIMQIRRRLFRSADHTIVSGKRNLNKGERVRLATSGLMVIECLRASLGLDDLLEKHKLVADYRAHKWDSKIPLKLHDGSLDGAVINEWSLSQYMNDHPNCELEVVCSCKKSMDGKCFYLIGLEKSHPRQLTFEDFRKSLLDTVIYVNDLPEHIRAVELFIQHSLTDSERRRLSVEKVEPSVAFQMLEANPKALIYCGQNFRLIAGQRKGYIEVIKWGDCPSELQMQLAELTSNCFVVSRRLAEYVGSDKLKKHCTQSQESFLRKCQNPHGRKDIIAQISPRLDDHEPEEKEVQEAIGQVLIKTFSTG